MRSLAILALIVSHVLPTADAQTAADTSAVHQAVLDYAYALYRTDPALLDRSVSRELVKVGVYAGDDGLGRVPMSFDQLRGLAATWNEGGRQVAPDAEPARIAVLDVLDRTATARLDAVWGVDHFHLAKEADGAWRIVHVLWQPPVQAARSED